jgi:hypothetical protein
MIQASYQGQPLHAHRPAHAGDAGFQAGSDQLVITLMDGTEKTVPRSDVIVAVAVPATPTDASTSAPPDVPADLFDPPQDDKGHS